MYLITYKKDNIIQFKSSKNKLSSTDDIKIIEQIHVPFYKEILVNFMFKWKSFWEHKIYKSSAYDFMETNENNCYGCEPSGDIYLENVLKWCDVQDNDKILDIGCGFGAALLIFNKYDFKDILGTEINNNIVDKLNNNLDLHKISEKVNTINCDVLGDVISSILYDFNYFYLFNPFNSSIMEKFIDKVIESYKIEKRKIRIIYRNPICNELFIDAGFNEVYEIKDFIGVKIKVYEYGE